MRRSLYALPSISLAALITSATAAAPVPPPRDLCPTSAAELGRIYAAAEPPLRPAGSASYNVLEIVWDTTRADHLSAYGYLRETTPFLDSIADDGIFFAHCGANAEWTIPSVASILTSLAPPSHKVYTQSIRLDDYWKTTLEILQQRGYYTGLFSGNPVVLDQQRNLDQGTDESDWLLRPDALLTDRFFEFVDAAADAPFAAHLQYYAAHGPYTPSAAFDSLFIGDPFYGGLGDVPGISLVSCKEGIPQAQVQDSILSMDYYMAQYDALIAEADHELERVFDGLESRGLLDSTLVILTADHGELLAGEHDRYFCHTTLYEGNNHVPLVLWLPAAWQREHGQIRGLWVDDPVSHLDLMPSIFDFLHMATPPQAQGESLFSRGSHAFSFSHSTGNRTVHDATQKFIHNGVRVSPTSNVERYDLLLDPAESTNLAAEDTASSIQMTTFLIGETQRLSDIDPPFTPGELYYAEDFENHEEALQRLFIAATSPDIWDWLIVDDPQLPGNSILYGYVVDTTQVLPDLWITGTCAVIDSPRRSSTVEVDLALGTGSVAVRTSWLSWNSTGYEAVVEPDSVHLVAHLPGGEQRTLGAAASSFAPWVTHRFRLKTLEGQVQLSVDQVPLVQAHVPRWRELYGTVEFAPLGFPTEVAFDNLRISSE